MLRSGFGGCRSLLLLLAWSCKSTFLVKYCVTYLGTRLFKHLKLRIHFCIVLLGVRLNRLSTREVSSEAYSPRNDPQINPENKDTDPEMIPIFFASTLKCSSVLIKIFGVEWYSSTELLVCHSVLIVYYCILQLNLPAVLVSGPHGLSFLFPSIAMSRSAWFSFIVFPFVVHFR